MGELFGVQAMQTGGMAQSLPSANGAHGKGHANTEVR